MKKSASKKPTVKEIEHQVTVLKADISTLKHTATRKHGMTKANAAKLQKDEATLKADDKTLTADKASKSSKHKSKLSPGWDVACCSAEALAASLRLAGHPVGYDDVFALYWRTARDPDEGASVLDTLRAARESGLAGHVPALNEQVVTDFGDDLAVLQLGKRVGGHLLRRDAAQLETLGGFVADGPFAHGLILGVQLPRGPHALTLDPSGGLWSWGELYDPARFAAAVIKEAWTVSWD